VEISKLGGGRKAAKEKICKMKKKRERKVRGGPERKKTSMFAKDFLEEERSMKGRKTRLKSNLSD